MRNIDVIETKTKTDPSVTFDVKIYFCKDKKYIFAS